MPRRRRNAIGTGEPPPPGPDNPPIPSEDIKGRRRVDQARTAGARERRIERRSQAWDLRKNGVSFREIAKALTQETGVPISEAQVHRDVLAKLRELARRDEFGAQEHLMKLLARAEAMVTALSTPALKGDTAASAEMRRWSEFTARIMGFFQPEQILLLYAKLGMTPRDTRAPWQPAPPPGEDDEDQDDTGGTTRHVIEWDLGEAAIDVTPPEGTNGTDATGAGGPDRAAGVRADRDEAGPPAAPPDAPRDADGVPDGEDAAG